MMISEFMHTDPMKFLPEDGSLELTAGWTGDVKYHLGGVKTTSSYGIEQRISLANNPSHLEIVAPVVIGKTRASQDDTKHAGKPTTDFHKGMPIIIHGDAASQIIELDSLRNQLMDVQQHIQLILRKVMTYQFYM